MKTALTALALIGALALPGLAQAQAKIVSVEDFGRPDSGATATWHQAFMAEIDGSGIEFEVFDNGALGGEREMHDLLQQGIVQVCHCALSALTARTPVLQITGTFPFLFDGYDEYYQFAIADGGLIDRVNDSAVPEYGVRVITTMPVGGPRMIFTTDTPVSSNEDMQGLRLRSFNPASAQILTDWGAQGVVIPWGETANALQTGVIDGLYQSPEAVLLFGMNAFLNYAYDLGDGFLGRAVIVSEPWWQSLTDDQRSAFMDATRAADAAAAAHATNAYDSVLAELEEGGIEFSAPTPDERQALVEIAEQQLEASYDAELVQYYLDGRDAVRATN